ncbi:MAG: hypothetical protein RR757_04740, partial [Raoultibacter sp.]
SYSVSSSPQAGRHEGQNNGHTTEIIEGGHEMTNEEKRKAMAEQIWLEYFNRTLLEKGLITEAEYHNMSNYIRNRKPTTATKA